MATVAGPYWPIAVIAVLAAVLAVARISWLALFLRRAGSAPGVVIEVLTETKRIVGSPGRTSTLYRPVVEYAHPDGRRIRYTEATATGPTRPVEPGQDVTVRFDRQRPERATIGDLTGKQMGGLTAFAVLALLLAAAVVLAGRAR
ncbi:hypothetical protein F4553_006765 [Allocatelliglobosispora scoriae]|uniref:DUF3592 domain-containing protein n=1 Tax=Allocatelliglobosispora scoriae TaxID=643052 RepID=A0A841C3B4_9ACTN|nr:DUF3592 domain-containing protein [Allocatelliglobosispora scoriae]MBB5873331.1 hypothetical protein [Allocatelliglobosispora scoriae]